MFRQNLIANKFKFVNNITNTRESDFFYPLLDFQESSIFKHLRGMVIDDMIYLINVEGLAELVKSTLNSEVELHFVDIEQDPPKVLNVFLCANIVSE